MEKNKFLDYIKIRIKNDNYRGIHLSQHNRLPFDKVLKILNIIYEFADKNSFLIHVGDWKGEKQENREIYYKIVNTLNKEIEQGTINSLKKNIFPDLDRMGFLFRYDKNNQRVNLKRSEIYSVQLTEKSIKFINEKNPRKQYKIYVESIEILLEPILDELFFLLFKEFETINVYEYMFILSDPKLTTSEKIQLIKFYRKLKKIEQINLKQEIIDIFSKINENASDKTEKRDFLNWYNQSLQTFNLLNQTIYFKTFGKTTLMLSISQEIMELFAKRSQKQKNLYFKWHKVERKERYHLHHIYPVSYFTNRRELSLIDNYKNLIYIKKRKHDELPKENLYVGLDYKNNKIILYNPLNINDFIDISNDVLIDYNNLDEMIKYNKNLLHHMC